MKHILLSRADLLALLSYKPLIKESFLGNAPDLSFDLYRDKVRYLLNGLNAGERRSLHIGDGIKITAMEVETPHVFNLRIEIVDLDVLMARAEAKQNAS